MNDEQIKVWREEFEDFYKDVDSAPNFKTNKYGGYSCIYAQENWSTYLAARKKAQEEIKDKDDLIIILKMKLDGARERVKERDGLIAEMEILKKENALLYRSYNKVCDEINRGEHLDFEWIRGIIQDEVTHPVIDASVKVVDSYRRKIDELKAELKREREAVDFYAKGNGIDEDDVEEMEADENMPFAGEQSGKLARQAQQQRRIEFVEHIKSENDKENNDCI